MANSGANSDAASTPRRELHRRWILEAFRRVGLQYARPDADVRPVPLTRLIEAFGITIQPVPDLTRQKALEYLKLTPASAEPVSDKDKSYLSGLMVHRPGGGIVLVNAHDILTRRRFTLAHELGHFLLHRPVNQSGILRYDLAEENGGDLSKEELARIEAEAHAFAADLLMPEPWVRHWFKTRDRGCANSPGLVSSRLATQFLVSRQAADRRVTDLGLLAGEEV